MFAEFPQIGGMVFAGDDEKFRNSIKLIQQEISYRKKLFVSYGGSFDEFNRNSKEKVPQILFIINNYDGLAESYPTFFEDVTSICRDCARYGIYFIMTLNMPSSLARKASLCFTNRFVFHFSDAVQYSDAFSMRCKIRPRDIVGRGLVYCDGGIHEFQTFSISDTDHSDSEIVQKLLSEVKTKNKTKAKQIPELPERVTMELIEKEIKDCRLIPIGVNRNSLKVAFIELTNYPIYTISSNRLSNMNPFMESLAMVLAKIPNCTIVFLDIQKQVPKVKEICPHYYDDNFDNVIDQLIKIEESDATRAKHYIYVFYGIEKIKSKISSTTVLENLINYVKTNEHSYIILGDSSKALRSLDYENWYIKARNAADGLWIGKGFGDQQIFRIGKLTKEMSRNYTNNYGYLDSDSTPELVKLIEFTDVVEEDGDLDEE